MLNRRLSAVMFADIVGYTALMQRDEREAVALRRRYREILDREVTRAAGEVVQYYGDGALSLFPSAVTAVRCAVEMQRSLRESPPMDVRIGIHAGEVVVDEAGAYGDAVNIAARIESLALPGAVFVSDRVADELKNHPDVRIRSVGTRSLKNVERPMPVFAIDEAGIFVPDGVESGAEGAAAARTVKRSVAVLPFVNMSADRDNEFFSDGITEEIINALTRVGDLKVTSRTSSFAFKGSQTDVREIARQLHVQNVLEGSVRKSGSRIRVTAQLVQADSGFHLFSQVYDRELTDIFAIQDEIAARISDRLRSAVGSRLAGGGSVDRSASVEAYSLYLQGRHHYARWTPESVRNSIGFYREALRIAPDYAKAYAGIATSYSFLGALGRGGYAEAREAARKALALDPESAESHIALGMVAIFQDWNSTAAEEHLAQAVQLGPGHADAHYSLSMFHLLSCDVTTARAHGEIALELDPLSLPILIQVGICRALDGDLQEGLRIMDRALEIDPTFRGAHEWKGWIYLETADYEAALEAFQRYARLSPNPYAGAWPIGVTYGRMGKQDLARQQLARLEEREQVEPDVLLHQDIAALLLALGDTEAALDRLERAADSHQGGLVFLRMSPVWRPAAEHPRFKAILAKIGFWDRHDGE